MVSNMIKQKMFHVLAIASIMFGSALMLGAGPATSTVYPGTIFAFGGSTCPSGSIAADGASLLRAGKYALLFSAISTSWGTADGTHFNAPDVRGLVQRGVDGSAGRDPDAGSRTAIATGGATGNNVGSYQADAYASHTHAYERATLQDAPNVGPGGSIGFTIGTWPSTATSASGGNETRGKNVYVKYCVKY